MPCGFPENGYGKKSIFIQIMGHLKCNLLLSIAMTLNQIEMCFISKMIKISSLMELKHEICIESSLN